jgi:hypothetical protein
MAEMATGYTWPPVEAAFKRIDSAAAEAQVAVEGFAVQVQADEPGHRR